jgi:hypothetical protein
VKIVGKHGDEVVDAAIEATEATKNVERAVQLARQLGERR